MYKHIEKEENKLTDEEVVKAWEYCLNKDTTCENCPYDKTNYCAISTEEIIDLIHRLQAENEQLRNAKVITETVDYCYEDLKEAQAEIERLKEYNQNLNGMNLEFIDKNAELQKQVDELKKENARLDKNVKWFQEKIEDGELVSKQAVKDTAKEIYDFAKGFFTWDEEGFVRELREFVQDYGVEVE